MAMSPGIFLRRAVVEDASSIARVLVASWRTTYPAIVAADFLSSLSEEEQTCRWAEKLKDAQRELCFIAVDEVDGPIGFASGGPDRWAGCGSSGELYAAYLLESFQRRGCGRGLLGLVFAELYRRALVPIRVEVLAGNPACGFYQKLGAEPLGERSVEFGGRSYPVIELLWSAAAVQAVAGRSPAAFSQDA